MIDAFTPVAQFMTEHPQVIEADLNLADARNRMASEGVRHLPVTREGRLVGMVSARDLMLLESLTEIDDERTLVESAMSVNPRVCTPETPVAEVLSLMEEKGVGAVPVVREGRVEGIFTSVDAVRILRDALL